MLLSEIFPPHVGGSGRWLYEVYRRMPPGSVTACVAQHARGTEFDRQEHAWIERRPLSFENWGIADPRGWRGYFTGYRVVSEAIRRLRPRELHCGRCLPEGWLALMMQARFGLPFVCYVHGEELPMARQSRELRWMTNRVLRRCRLLVANSYNTARMLREEWSVPDDKVRILHPGVDTARFVPASASPGVRDKLGWSGAKVVFTVGRLQKRKGHDMLIRALPAIRSQIPDVLYAIAGNGLELETLKRLSAETGVSDLVRFHGEVSDEQMIECYQQCDLFALPNREVDGDIEGFGMVLLEAQASGKPVIAGASGGTRETMVVGETGLIVDCTRPEPLAEAVAQLLRDPGLRATMGRDAREWVVANFEWTALAQQAGELFASYPAVSA
ncbi:MAG: glycosyltransferase family 4 protein [Pirellulaceae bacterium]